MFKDEKLLIRFISVDPKNFFGLPVYKNKLDYFFANPNSYAKNIKLW